MDVDPLTTLAHPALETSTCPFSSSTSDDADIRMDSRQNDTREDALPIDNGIQIYSDTILLPSELLSNGEFSTTYMNLQPMRNDQLLQLIRKWRLRPEKMNKASYKAVLRSFGADRMAWEERKPGNRRPHKGPRTQSGYTASSSLQSTTEPSRDSRRPKYTRGSFRRRDTMIMEIAEKQREGVSQRSRDMMIIGDPSSMQKWARTLVEKELESQAIAVSPTDVATRQDSETAFPEHESSRSSPIGAALPRPAVPSTDTSVGDSSSTTHSLTSVLHRMLRCVQRLEQQTDRVTESCQDVSPTVSSTAQSSLNFHSHSAVPFMDQATDSKLVLASGTVHFNASEIPDPPYISFADDLARLNGIWDDSLPSWNDSSPLEIRGKSIALVHWPNVYRYRGNQRWTAIKQRWFTWKVLAMEYQSMTPEAFWAKYSSHGRRMGITKISNLLKQARKARDQDLADQAKERFGDTFSAVFAYRQGGEGSRRVKTSISSIARSYELLQTKHMLTGDGDRLEEHIVGTVID